MKLSVCLVLGGFLILTGCENDGIKIDLQEFKFGKNEISESLEGKWKFSIGDDKQWALPSYNDKSWEEIKVPSPWENEGFHGYNGFAWYRKKFKVPKEVKSTGFYLNLGYIDDVDETYINGHLVGVSGGFPPEFVTAYDAQRKYFVPKSLLKDGDNLIAVRVYDSQLEGGITRGQIGISPVKPDQLLISDLDMDINLSGFWKFSIGDNLDWKEKSFDDSKWGKIFVPAYWETQGYKDYDGFAWYRTSFTLPEEFKDRKMVLVLGMIDDIDQTYINGILVGSIGDWHFNTVPSSFNQHDEWQSFRGYYLPDSVLISGKENTIAVRVYDGFKDGGIYKGPIGLITQEKYRTVWKKNK